MTYFTKEHHIVLRHEKRSGVVMIENGETNQSFDVFNHIVHIDFLRRYIYAD